jgi:hypothetical protein
VAHRDRLYLSPHADDALRERATQALELLAAELAECARGDLAGLVLAGGYGRGQGAVVRTPHGLQLYNDLDLMVLTRSRRPPWTRALPAIAHRYEQQLGVAVDFSRPLPLEDLTSLPPRLMWQDMLDGHTVLYGSPRLLWQRTPAWYGSELDVSEATALLLNRGAGLLWALRVYHQLEPPPDCDFVRRNLHKAALACGDACLLARGQWPAHQGERLRFLTTLAATEPSLGLELGFPPSLKRRLLRAYRLALAFKEQPQRVRGRVSRRALEVRVRLWSDLWLRLEGLRWGQRFATSADYAAWPRVREPRSHASPLCLLRNLVRNLRWGRPQLGGARGGLFSHPREQLYRQLPCLLDPTATWAGSAFDRESAACLRLWHQGPA